MAANIQMSGGLHTRAKERPSFDLKVPTIPVSKNPVQMKGLFASPANSPMSHLKSPAERLPISFQQLSGAPGTLRSKRASERYGNSIRLYARQQSVVRLNSVVEIDEQCVVEVFCFARWLVNHTFPLCFVLWCIVGLSVYLAYTVFGLDDIGNYSPSSYSDVKLEAAYDLIREESWDEFVVPERTQSVPHWDLYIWARANGRNILTPSTIQELYNLEETIINLENYTQYCMLDISGDCEKPTSILSELEKKNQTEIDAYILELVISNDNEKLAMLSSDVSAENLQSKWYRSVHKMGNPLPGYANMIDCSGTQSDIYEEWVWNYFEYFRDDLSQSVTGAELYSAAYLVYGNMFFVAIGRTHFYVIASICGVFLLLGAYIRSWYLAVIGLLCIVLTFGPAITLFVYVFGVTYFDALMMAILYVILGIGADDIFVFTDAWRQAPYLALGADEDLAIRMSYAYSRATKAMALTQVTTIIAFVATAISDIIPIKAFGFWSATCIGVAYMMVVTIYPLALVIEFKYPWVDCGAGRCFTWCNSTVEVVDDTGIVNRKPEPNKVERFFATTFLKFLQQFKYCLLFLGVAVGSIGVWATTSLSPPTKPDTYLTTASYEGIGMNMLGSDEFGGSQELTATEPYIVWGIETVDLTGVDFWDGGEGKLITDGDFEPSPSENQQHLVYVCDTKIPALADELYILDISQLVCPMQDFREFALATVGTFPVNQSDFNDLFAVFLMSEFGVRTIENAVAGLIDGVVSYIALKIPVDLYSLAAGTEKKPVYTAWVNMKNNLNTFAPAGVNKAVLTCAMSEWSWMRTQEALVRGAWNGICVALPTAFLAILIFTRNLIISLFAIVTIIEIMLTISIVIVFMGWELGIVETISLVIIIGFSVDYVVHLGHSYWEARHNKKDRIGRAKIALMTMGGTVSMGAITTFFGGLPLIFTEIVIFIKMGTLMVCTVSFAWFWSLCLFVPLLMVFGPQGKADWISKKNKTFREMLQLDMAEMAEFGSNQSLQNVSHQSLQHLSSTCLSDNDGIEL